MTLIYIKKIFKFNWGYPSQRNYYIRCLSQISFWVISDILKIKWFEDVINFDIYYIYVFM